MSGPRPKIEMVGSHGSFDGEWIVEEDSGATRQSIRVRERLHVEKSKYQDIAVYETDFFGRVLTLDGLVMFTERDEFVYHEMLAHVPLCALPEPESVLIIGGGDCGIAREALKHTCVKRVVQCDIDERVTEVSKQYFPWVAPVTEDPRLELVFDDGIGYIENHQNSFDLIVIDSTDPIGPAVGLFSRSFYSKAGAALKAGGVMVAQTESPHWGSELVGQIYEEVRAAFRHVSAYMGFIPTYPSGSWCWCFASNDRQSGDFFDDDRAAAISQSCKYYNPALQRGAFALPTFAQRAISGEDMFKRFRNRSK